MNTTMKIFTTRSMTQALSPTISLFNLIISNYILKITENLIYDEIFNTIIVFRSSAASELSINSSKCGHLDSYFEV
jgi:hypothetical protein